MSKLRIALAAMVIAAGSFATFAFTTNENTKSTLSADDELHWFDEEGNYLGPKTIAEQDAECPGTGNVCAIGYVGENNGQPVGQPQYTAERN